MKMRDGKDSFYRTLELDDEAWAIIKWFRKIKKQMMNDPENLTPNA